MKCYRDLIVWQKGKVLAIAIYRLTRSFPKEEIYGLSSQIRRSAVSIPSNIAEGSGRKTTNDYLHFLYMSRGSLFELQTQCEIAKEISYINEEKFNELSDQINEIERILNALIHKLETKI